MRHALLAALSLPLAIGCAHPRASRPAATATKAAPPIARFGDVDVARLPRGAFPPVPNARVSVKAWSRATPGIYVNTATEPPRVTGVKHDTDLFEVAIKDQPDSAGAYCFAYGSLAGSPAEGSFGLVTQTAIPLVDDEFGVRAERVVDDPTGQARFELVRGWVSDRRGFARQGQGSAALERLATFEGVDVFAFVDDSPERTSSSVDFVVRRPALHHAAVRFAAFFARLPDGRAGAGACSHIRIALPIVHGDAASAIVDVGVETDNGARRVRIQLGTLWLPGATSATATARLDWRGPEVEELALPDPEGSNQLTSKRRRSR